MNCVMYWSLKPVPVAFLFPLFLADLDKKYGNEIEMDKKIIVKLIWNMFISKLRYPERKENNSLTSSADSKPSESMNCVT